MHARRRFAEAIRAGRISKVEKIDDCCVLAAVGRQMASRKGVAATMFSALAKANINIRRAPQLDPGSMKKRITGASRVLPTGRPQSCRGSATTHPLCEACTY